MAESNRTSLAIVGMACRFPGGLNSPDKLWQAVLDRYSAISSIPADRWTADRYFSSEEIAKGKSYIRRGGFLTEDVSLFDAAFFGISPREAENMDPQQRLLLEVVWEAFENAGLSLPTLAGRPIGVYVGGFMLDHMITQMAPANRSQINQNTAAGMMMTMLSNRISHTYDLRGPSLSIDTACSSSLVAMHYACQDVWRGDCEMAVVGGSNVMLRPEYPMGMCKGHFLARDGECKSFDSRGDGYGRGEGAGAVLVKPLQAAIDNGDQILATVQATGTNQDGRTPGVSMPSGEAQAALIEKVRDTYDIDWKAVRYVECHGTGTAIGDPTEAAAIAKTYGTADRDSGPVVIGSIKSNIGHLEACAGVAGLIKAVLTLQSGVAGPLANLQEPNPKIDLESRNVRLADEPINLAEKGEDFSVAVNSFGYGGSNAHVILGRAAVGIDPPAQPRAESNGHVHADDTLGGTHLLPLSARSDKALNAVAGEYADLLNAGTDISSVLRSASHHRAQLSHRGVVLGRNRKELIEALTKLNADESDDQVVRGVEPFSGKREPVFVFTGMGPQWWGMGQELHRSSATYRRAVTEADEAFNAIAGFSILKEMLLPEEESQITLTEFAQPANFIVQIGVLALLKEGGVSAGAFVGHSVGEVASAYAAGVLTLEEAMLVSFHRSQLQASTRGAGGMLAIGCDLEMATAIIEPFDGAISIAAINGPTNMTLAGDTEALQEVAESLTQSETFNRALDVEVAYHSPTMDPILGPLGKALAGLSPMAPKATLYSTVTGKSVEVPSFDADYWKCNVRDSVRFADAIRSAIDDGYNTFIEVGPHPVLANSLREIFKDAGADARNTYTLRRNQPEATNVLRAIGQVFAFGCPIDWTTQHRSGSFVALPNYQWQRERFWLENDRGKQDRIATIDHPILGIQEAPGAPVWRNDFDHEPVLYLRDHVVDGMPVLPAAAYIESMFELAAIQHEQAPGLAIRGLQIEAPMLIKTERGLDSVTAYDPVSRSATMRSLENGRLGEGQVHTQASLSSLSVSAQQAHDLPSLQKRFVDKHDVAAFYERLAKIGLEYGPAFQTIRELSTVSDESVPTSLSRIEIQPELIHDLPLYRLHPTLLDACFQSLFSLVDGSSVMYLPTGIDEICLYESQSPHTVWCVAERRGMSGSKIVCDLTLLDAEGKVVVTIRGLRLSEAAERPLIDKFGDLIKQQVLTYEWRYGSEVGEPKRLGHWLLIDGNEELTDAVASRLTDYGATVTGRINQSAFELESDESISTVMDASEPLDGVLVINAPTENQKDRDPTGETAIEGLARLMQLLGKSEMAHRPRLYVTTLGAFAVQDFDTTVNAGQTALNGFARVAFNELEGFQLTTIDLPTESDEETVDTLVREALADDLHDEVAIRSNGRFVSELVDSDLLATDEFDYRPLDDAHPVLVRPLTEGSDSVGTAKVVATVVKPVGPNDLRLRIEATVVPKEVLLDPRSSSLSDPYVEVVARVIEVGSEVTDLTQGTRVAGWVTPDLASHLVIDRQAAILVPIPEEGSAIDLVATFGLASRMEVAAEELRLSEGDHALIDFGSAGDALALALGRRGVQTTRLDSEPSSSEAGDTFARSAEGIAEAMACCTAGKGFDALAADMTCWMKEFDQRALTHGGSLIDLADRSSPLQLGADVAAVIRTDLSALANRRSLPNALSTSAECIIEESIPVSSSLDVSLNDMAWQKLPLADAKSKLVLTYETGEADLPVVRRHDLQFHADATYLVTGGFGGLGKKTVEWLIEKGAGNVVLTGRTGADTPDRVTFLEQLTERGVAARAYACDTSDLHRLKEVLAMVDQELPPLRGVFHSGALIEDQPIEDIDTGTLRRVMRSKAMGAWNLHLATENHPLDHFVMYSSVANLVGNSRQSIYSAANGYLNGLAHERRVAGKPGLAVCWGAISDVGVVSRDEKLEQFLRYTGLRGIAADDGLAILSDAMARGVTQFGITMITSWADWARFETRGAKSPRFASLIAADSAGEDSSVRDALAEELKSLSRSDQIELLASLIVEILADVLKSDPSTILIDRAVSQLGIDSLMATDIQMTLDTQLGISVPVLQLIGETTARDLATTALADLLGETAQERSPALA